MKTLTFKARLVRLAPGINYFALIVPLKITQALGTKGPVLVSAKVNGSKPFQVSLYTRGGGRHGLRVKAKVREEVQIKVGDLVKVQIEVIDRASVPLPKDLISALKKKGVLAPFKALPHGKRNYLIRLINDAHKEETRKKRIQEAVKTVATIMP